MCGQSAGDDLSGHCFKLSMSMSGHYLLPWNGSSDKLFVRFLGGSGKLLNAQLFLILGAKEASQVFSLCEYQLSP